MAKKKTPKKKKSRTPKVGDTVFKKGGTSYQEWIYQKNVIHKGVELAYITSVVPKMKDGELEVNESLVEMVPKESLTLISPPQPTQIYTG